MPSWEELSPSVRRSVFIGAALLLLLLGLRFYASSPVGKTTPQRGIAAQ